MTRVLLCLIKASLCRSRANLFVSTVVIYQYYVVSTNIGGLTTTRADFTSTLVATGTEWVSWINAGDIRALANLQEPGPATGDVNRFVTNP